MENTIATKREKDLTNAHKDLLKLNFAVLTHSIAHVTRQNGRMELLNFELELLQDIAFLSFFLKKH